MAFAQETAKGQHYMYVAPKNETTSGAAALNDITGYGFPYRGDNRVSEILTESRQTPQVIRVALRPEVAQDMEAQQQTNLRFGHTPQIQAADRNACDLEAMERFGVSEKRAAQIQAAHFVAVVHHTNTGKKLQPSQEQLEEALQTTLEKFPKSQMLLMQARKGQEPRYYLLWRSHEGRSDDLAEKFRAVGGTRQAEMLGKTLRLTPSYVWSLQLDEDAFKELQQEHPQIETLGEEKNPIKARQRREIAEEVFNRRDNEAEMAAVDPLGAALEHLSGRKVLAVAVRHISDGQMRAALEGLHIETVHAAISALRSIHPQTNDALAVLEEAVVNLSHIPQAASSAQTAASAVGQLRQAGKDAVTHYDEIRQAYSEYQEWVKEYAADGKPVTQLVVMNPTENTVRLLNNPAVQEQMTRPPELHENLVRGHSVLMLYPKPEWLESYRQQKGGRLSYLQSSSAPQSVKEVMQAIRCQFVPAAKPSNLEYFKPDAARVFGYQRERLDNLGDNKPLLTYEEPTQPPSSVKAEQPIGKRPVLIFRVDPSNRRACSKIAAVIEGFTPFLEGRTFFGDVIRVMPELTPQEQEYHTLSKQKDLLQQEFNCLARIRRTLETAEGGKTYPLVVKELGNLAGQEALKAWGLSGDRDRDAATHAPLELGQHIASLCETVEGRLKESRIKKSAMETENEGIATKIEAYRAVEEDGGEERVAVHKDTQRVYALDGTGFADFDAALAALNGKEGYVKLYLSSPLEQVCLDEIRSYSRKYFKNTSSNEGVLRPVKEECLEAHAAGAFSEERGR